MHSVSHAWLMAGFLALAAGCGSDTDVSMKPVALTFAARVGDREFLCGESYDIGKPSAAVTFSDLRFYVHDVRLITKDGDEVPVDLTPDDFQHDGIALLDFEDGMDGCSGNSAFNPIVHGNVPEGEYTGLVFRLGLPFDLNHGQEADSPSPLNLSDMFWRWKDGYKFIRVDSPDVDRPGLRLHLGSTGCVTDARGRTTKCTNENTPEIRIANFDADKSDIVVDLASLFANSNVTENEPDSPTGCMSNPDDSDCAPIFEALGLSFGDTAGTVQSVFRAE